MNMKVQYEKPLLLLFSDLTVEAFNILLSDSEDIILRQHKQLFSQGNDLSVQPSYKWNIQYGGIELNIIWLNQYESVQDYKQVFCNIDPNILNSAVAISLGSHVKDGRMNTVIMECFFRYVKKLIIMSGPAAVAWSVSKILSDSQYYVDAINQYENGGAFPILPTIDFVHSQDGVLKSNGLSYFSNQEIYYEGGHLGYVESMKRVMRMAHDIAVNGAYKDNMQVDGLERGERIFINISNDGYIAQARSVF